MNINMNHKIDKSTFKDIKLTIGIGASAGGLTALKKLVRTLPKNENIAYIIIQHLDPTHESTLTELLNRECPLPIQVAENKMVLAPDNVYVIPPKVYLEIENGKIKLTNPKEERGMRKAIDHLFRSMSEECQKKCVGIVLTGAGNDGTTGLRFIKAGGGFTIAQAPASADHPSMPESAINSGVIDKILTIENMMDEIVSYVNHPYISQITDEDDADILKLNDNLKTVGSILSSHEEFDLEPYKPSTIQRRIARRMGLSGLKDIKDYLDKTRYDPTERKLLIKDLLINVTDFFRDPVAFKELESSILPQLISSLDNQEDLRVWVAGCATGEEVYSLTILLMECMNSAGRKSNIHVFATDIDEEAIAVARKGIYPNGVISGVPKPYVDRYFNKVKEDHYQIQSQVRDLISFANQNVVTDPPFSRMHLISCRNLLIYLKKEVQQDVLNAFHFSLKPNGFLFLGSAESLGSNSPKFKVVSKKWRLYERTQGSGVRTEFQKLYRTNNRLKEKKNSDNTKSSSESHSDLLRKDLLSAALPPSMIIGEKGEILYNHGQLSPYVTVPEGEPHTDLLKTIIPALSSRVRSSIFKARKSKKPVSFTYIPKTGQKQRIKVEVKLLSTNHSSIQNGICISFIDLGRFDEESSMPTDMEHDKALLQIEQELVETKEELQNTIEELETSTEELKATHEEALSTNEELQSTNEELEASTEELRSLNEELRRVNDQLKDKIDLLQSANNDLKNFFSSTNIPTIFLDLNFHIKQFTPAAEIILGIGATDVGRPIHTIGSPLINDDFITKAKKVLLTFESIQCEVQTFKSHWFLMVMSPYLTEDRRIAGIVVTFQDISEIKRLSVSANRRERQQATVAQLGMLALSDISIDEFMNNLVRKVAYTLDVEYCKILKYRPERKDLLLVSGVGWRKGIVGIATVPDRQDSQAGYTLLQKEPVIVDHIQKEKRFSGPGLLIDHDVVSGMSVTINHSNPPFGVLGIHSSSYVEFDSDDANFALAVANLLSYAVKESEASEALRESEKRLRVAKDSANLGSFEYYIQDGSVEWDSLLRKIWGYSNNEKLTIKNFWDCIHTDDLERVKLAIEKSTDPSGDGQYAAKYRVVNKKENKTYWVHGNGRTLFKNGHGIKMIGMIQDISESKELEISLKAALEKLQGVNQRKNEFLATLGHELRNPLAAIDSSVHALDINQPKNSKLTKILSRNVKMMSNMLDDLLDLSRIDSGTVVINREPLELTELIRNTINEYKFLFELKNQHVKLTVENQPVIIDGDAIRIEQILGNLLTNAQKFTHENGIIEVSVETSGTNVYIKMKDNGVGMEGELDVIFNPFSQVDPSKGNKGLGLGLALVKRFSEMHDGKVEVTSDGKGKGSTFTLTFPLSNKAVSSKTKDEAKTGISQVKIKPGLGVMIVDDNVDSSKLLKIFLDKYKCKVVLAHTGAEALELLNDTQPEVFLLDIGLPDMDGFELLNKIKSTYTKPAFYIAHTGYGHQEAVEKTKNAGFNYHFTKPLNMQIFLDILSKVD